MFFENGADMDAVVVKNSWDLEIKAVGVLEFWSFGVVGWDVWVGI